MSEPQVDALAQPSITDAYVSEESRVLDPAVLDKSLIERSFKPNGSYILAVYDPPTRLPFLRRNEILIPIKEISYSEEIGSGGLL